MIWISQKITYKGFKKTYDGWIPTFVQSSEGVPKFGWSPEGSVRILMVKNNKKPPPQ